MFYVYAILIFAALAFALFGMFADVGVKQLALPLGMSLFFSFLAFTSAIEGGQYALGLILCGVTITTWIGFMMYVLVRHINKRAASATNFGFLAG